MEDEQIKQEALKEAALEDEELEDVAGGIKKAIKIIHRTDGGKRVYSGN